MLNIEQIKEIIPHRYPFLLVDKILEVDEGKERLELKMYLQTKNSLMDTSLTMQLCLAYLL